MESVRDRKKTLRRIVAQILKALPEEYRVSASANIQDQVLASEEYRRAERIFLYIAMPTEPDTGRIIERALSDGKEVYVPKCVSKTEMIAVRIRSTDDLKPGAYGILEPQDCSETIEANEPDLIIVPCVSASKDGKRLGHGAGYYDRFLKGNADKTLCLCFEKVLTPDIPMDENDVFMHRVIFDETKWIFFDLGSTLIDETKADLHRIREMTAGTDVTANAYCEKRLELIGRGLPGDQTAITFFGLTKTPWHSEDETPYPDAAPTLNELKRRGFKLGVIANQNPGTKRRLADWDLLQFFDVIAASAELGVAKPDPAVFRWALAQANCSAQNAFMVGDRLDNDIAPANRLGMHTVRLLRGLGAYHKPQSADEVPEYTIQTLSELFHLL